MPEFPTVALGEEKAETYYCRHCETTCVDRDVMNTHLDKKHEIYYARQRSDYITGTDLMVERMELMRRFDLVTESLVGVDDFLFECGG